MEELFTKYSTQKKKGAPTSARAEIADKTAQLLNQDIKKVLGWTRHLQPDQIYKLYQEAHGTPQFWWTLFRDKYSKNNMEKLMKEKLTKFVEFRERSKRGLFLTKWSLRDVEVDSQTEDGQWKKISLLDKQKAGTMMTMNELSAFAIRYASLERMWRFVLNKDENKHLRGSDYLQGEALEEKKMRDLGYRD